MGLAEAGCAPPAPRLMFTLLFESQTQPDSARLVQLFQIVPNCCINSLRRSQTHPGTFPPASHLLPGYHLTVTSTVGHADAKSIENSCTSMFNKLLLENTAYCLLRHQ